MLIFAFGILGLVGLQAVAIRNTNDLQYRGEAIQIANAAMGRMWTMDRTKLKAMYEGDTGSRRQRLRRAVRERRSGCPASSSNTALAPTVVVVDGPSTTSNLVTVTMRWQLPGDATPHQYVGAVMVGLNP